MSIWEEARSGSNGDPAGSENGGTGVLNLSGEDLPAVVAEAYPSGLQLPQSLHRDDAVAYVNQVFAEYAAEPNAYSSMGLVATTYEFWAVCTWNREWLLADGLGDLRRRAVASEWLGDPGNFPSIVANDGGGVVDHLLEVARGAARGDRGIVQRGYRDGACEAILGVLDR